MDPYKTFDSLYHALSITKLHADGVDGFARERVYYPRYHEEGVKIGTTRSTWMGLTQRVSQGSRLGPLLFNIFVNGLIPFIENCTL